jgi:hypothetical protein
MAGMRSHSTALLDVGGTGGHDQKHCTGQSTIRKKRLDPRFDLNEEQIRKASYDLPQWRKGGSSYYKLKLWVKSIKSPLRKTPACSIALLGGCLQ